MALTGVSLVKQFDELVAATDVLTAGTDGVFGSFVSSQMDFFKGYDDLKNKNDKLKGDNEAKDIKLKLSRNSLEDQMNECTVLKSKLKEYEKQFTILKVLISSDDKFINLNEAEQRSLALLKKRHSSFSPTVFEGSQNWNSPDTSVNVTDATDLDDDDNGHRTWKRRRTCSSEWTLDSSVPKRKKSLENVLQSSEKMPFFDLDGDVHMTPPLEKKFKKPPPGKNRRKPSKGHLVHRNNQETVSPQSPVVPRLEILNDESPVPSAPPESELISSGLLSPQSTEVTPNKQHPEDLSFNHSPISPMSLQPFPSTPLNAILSSRLYPALHDDEDEDETDENDYCTPMTTPGIQRPLNGAKSDINLTRKHVFITKTALKPETCEVCKKKVGGFGRNCLKCKDCRAVCCVECKDKVPLPCVPAVHTPKKRQKDSELASYCPHTIPRVPSLVVHCVKEIESRGLTQVGIYRVPGSERTIKELKERLLKAKGTPNLQKIEDINVVCGCLKQFFIALREPLITNRLNPIFMQAIDEKSEAQVLAALFETIAQLPPCNKDTLAFIILHLQKVNVYSDANKMPIESLARVFGPTIVGSSSTNPANVMRDIHKQKAIMERLLNISPDYWRQYLSPDENPDPQSPTTNQLPSSATSTPVITSPSTPELMPVPQSPYLGPCQSPRAKLFVTRRTPVVTRSSKTQFNNIPAVSQSAKKNGFFPPIN